ncbi:MAG: PEP-CTERM sorting domain-containing protein [Opitutales bacterium]|nr:PEP-CTERM sorting domain-containing protein [Opitutales bacterium]
MVNSDASWSTQISDQSFSISSGYSMWGDLGLDGQISSFSNFNYSYELGGNTYYGTGSLTVFGSNGQVQGVVIDFTDRTLSGSFDNVSLSGTPIQMDYFDNSGDFYLNSIFPNNDMLLITTAIPEPSTYAAILGGFAFGYFVYRRRRRKV